MENKSHVPKHRSLIIHVYLYIVTIIYKTPTRKGLKNALPLKTHDVSHGFPTVFPSCFPWFSHGFPMVFPTPGSAVGSACTQPSFNICCRSSKRRGAKSPRLVISSFLATELEVLLEVPWEKKRPEAETCADYALTIFNYVWLRHRFEWHVWLRHEIVLIWTYVKVKEHIQSC